MKKKRTLSLLAVICLVLAAVIRFSPQALAASYTTKAECATNVTTIGATAPGSVMPNTPFNVTNITSSSSAPSGITVTKIVSTSSVSNATPSTVTGTWTGTATGAFTVNFPSITLTPTGAAGSQVKLTLTQIDIYINNGSSPIVTCNKANGQLTADKAGESLTIFSIPVVAPVTTPPPTTTTPTPTSTNTTNTSTTNSTTPSTTKTPTSTGTQNTQNTTTDTPTGTQTGAKSQLVTITVVDASGGPLSDVPVTIDNGQPVKTNTRGVAIFENLATGKHKVAVLGKNTQITRDINVNGGSEPVELTVQMPHQLISPLIAMIVGAVVLTVALGVAAGFVLKRRRRAKDLARHIAPGAGTMPPITPVIPVSASAVPEPMQPLVDPQPAPAPPALPIAPETIPAPTPPPTPAVSVGPIPIESTPAEPVVQSPVAVQPPIPQASPTAPVEVPAQTAVPLAPTVTTIQPGQTVAPQVPSQT